MNTNILSEIYFSAVNDVDGYKFGQFLQFPPNTNDIFSYGESRGSKIKGITDTVYVGLQYFLKEYLSKQITIEDIEFTKSFCEIYGTEFNYDGWKYIVDHHNGYLPLTIKSAPEGSIIPTNNVLYTIHASDPNCFWLVSYVETALLRAIWYPTSVATISYHVKKIIYNYLKETSDQIASLEYGGLSDFGARGATCNEQARIGGAAHAFVFSDSSDNVQGLMHAMKYYDYKPRRATVNASEHSSMSSWTISREFDAYQNMVKQYARPGNVFACVIDTFNIDKALSEYWIDGGLLDEVKDKGATVVLRPDSGNPSDVMLRLLDICSHKLSDQIIVNSKGYKVLPSHVRFIYGDGMSIETIPVLLQTLKDAGWSTENVVCIGMGGKLLQGIDRDTFKFAQKCSCALVDDVFVDVYKDPIDDPGKQSKKGRLTLIKDDYGNYHTIRLEDPLERKEELDIVFKNGHIMKYYSFDEINERINEYFKM